MDNPNDPSPKELLEVQDEGKTFQKGRLGWRKDVMGCLAKDGELEIPMLRWPGGEYLPSSSSTCSTCKSINLYNR